MKYEEYLEFVKANCSTSTRSFQDQVTHASMGLSGEAGEVLEWHKKKIFHGRDMKREDLILELGDVLYYYTRLAALIWSNARRDHGGQRGQDITQKRDAHWRMGKQMTSRDFVYWLQGFMEISEATEITPKQLDVIKNHLSMVFKHEIDPSHGDAAHQKKLSDAHQGVKSIIDSMRDGTQALINC